MALPSPSNPVNYIFNRQYKDKYLLSKTLLRERLGHARNLYRKDLLAHYGCVNAIEFSNEGELLVSGGDDRRVLLWKVEEAIHGVGKPVAMRAQHISNIFCLGYDSTNSKIFSAGNDDQVIVHDTRTGDPIDFFLHEQPVYGLSIDPLNDNVFASACDDGRVLIFDIREPASTEPFCLAGYTSAFHAVMFNPVEPRLLTTANSKEGVGLWDIRKPRQVVLRYGLGNGPPQSCMSARFNSRGTHVLALRRRLPPVLYAVHSPAHVCQFDHQGYYNSCTMKSCCFAGDADDYVLSGSDDFNLYVWKIPTDLGVDGQAHWIVKAHMVLKGHRSIVNQVRFNYTNYLIASSGVEKLIKFWSPFPLPGSSGGLAKESESCEKQRKVYTHEEYISLVLRSGQFMSHDYSNQSTREDPRMMAFFDSLVQREIEGWGSGSEGSSVEDGVRSWEGRRWVPQAAVATQTTDDGVLEANPLSSTPPAPPPPPDVNNTAELSSLSSPETSSPSPSLTSTSSSTSVSSSTSLSSSSSSSACMESESDSEDSSNSASDTRDHDLHALAAAYVGAISENQDEQMLPREQVLESWSREEGSGTPNRISQLIAQKRAQLVRLARVKHRRQSPHHQPKWRQSSSGQGASTQTSLVSIARILFPSEDANSNSIDEANEEGQDRLREVRRAAEDPPPSGGGSRQKSRTDKGGDGSNKKSGRQHQKNKGASKLGNDAPLKGDTPSVSGVQKEGPIKKSLEGTSKVVLGSGDKSLPPVDGKRTRRKRPSRARRLVIGSKRKVDSSDNDSSNDGDSSDMLPLKKRAKGTVKCSSAQPISDNEVRDKASVSQGVLPSSHKCDSERNGSAAKSGDKQIVGNSKVSGYSSSSSGCTSEEGEDLGGRKSGPNHKGKRPVKLCKVLLRLNHNHEKVTNGSSVNGQGSSSTPSSGLNGKVCTPEQESLSVSPVPMRHSLETPDSGIASGQCRESSGAANGSTTNGNAGQLTEGSSGSSCVFKRLNRRSGKAPYRNYRSKVGYDSDSN